MELQPHHLQWIAAVRYPALASLNCLIFDTKQLVRARAMTLDHHRQRGTLPAGPAPDVLVLLQEEALAGTAAQLAGAADPVAAAGWAYLLQIVASFGHLPETQLRRLHEALGCTMKEHV